MENGVLLDGYPSLEEIESNCGWPGEDRFAKGPVAVIECVQEIPCNPCEGACPYGAIEVGDLITNIPKLDRQKCIGCGLCVASCSGLAIFIVDKTHSETEGTVSFPFEYYPLPEKGDEVEALTRAGEFVCRGTVVRTVNPKRNDHTTVVTIAVPKEHADMVRTIKRPCATEICAGFEPVTQGEKTGDDVIVCRCEEITAGEIRAAIREGRAKSVTEVKRRVRSGMGLCQGKSCGRQITRILCEELGGDLSEKHPATDRAPVRPVSFGELCGEGGDDNG